MTPPTRTPPIARLRVYPQRVHPRRVVTVDRVVLSGVPAAELDPATATTSLTATLQGLIARRLGGLELPPGRRVNTIIRVTWSPTAGIDALGERLAAGVADAIRTAGHE